MIQSTKNETEETSVQNIFFSPFPVNYLDFLCQIILYTCKTRNFKGNPSFNLQNIGTKKVSFIVSNPEWSMIIMEALN